MDEKTQKNLSILDLKEEQLRKIIQDCNDALEMFRGIKYRIEEHGMTWDESVKAATSFNNSAIVAAVLDELCF